MTNNDNDPTLDSPKDGHGRKVVVIPFDGVALDRDLQSLVTSFKQ